VTTWTEGDQIEFLDVDVFLFVPIGFEELWSRCRPCATGSWNSLCVFGINPRFTASPSRFSHFNKTGNIKHLIVAENAGILPPSSRSPNGRSFNVAERGVAEDPAAFFSLVLRDPTPTPLTASTIDFVLEFFEFGSASVIEEFGHEPYLDLECYPAVFESFIPSVSS
jgi:hypothetical protein